MTSLPAEVEAFIAKTACRDPINGGQKVPRFTRLAGDGSNRKLYRINDGACTRVLAINDPDAETVAAENRAWQAVHAFLQEAAIAVPKLFDVDLSRGYFLMEDLGNRRLFELSRQADAVESVSEIYLAAVAILVRLGRQKIPSPIAALNPPYTTNFILEHESRYFHSQYLTNYCRLSVSFETLAPEYQRLAEKALSPHPGPGASAAPPRLIHRDYQSRNLMLPDNPELRGKPNLVVIDFQGARIGPAEYDLASLIFDPYQTLSDSLQIQLVCRFLGLDITDGVNNIDFFDWLSKENRLPPLWSDRFLANAANRLLQVHGAFAKLGGRLGRQGFLEFLPAANRTLSQVLAAIGDCPDLENILAEAIERGN